MLDQKIINLYDEYTHKPLTRKDFMVRLVQLAGSTTAALSMLAMLESGCSTASKTPSDELMTENVTYPGGKGDMMAYVARPKANKKYAAVVVIHENRGLNAHIEDVTRRVARAGYLAIAPNALSPLGGTPANEDEARKLFTQLNAEDSLQHFIKAFDYLGARKDCNDQFGCVGFCWGGAMSNKLAVNVPSLKAAVVFYGTQPAVEDVSKIKAAIQMHYASLDERVNARMAEYENALKAAGVEYEQYLYEGINHAFHNDTSTARYNEAAAKLAWQRTIAFLDKEL